MGAIGGYFELELSKKNLYYSEGFYTNSARNGFEYILLANGYRNVLVPFFTCEVLLEPLLRNGISWEFYHIDENLEPIDLPNQLLPNEAFLYTNYFGIKDKYINQLANKQDINIIVDNAQSFFSKPLPHLNTFYSPRKFFGLPDGGIAFSKKEMEVSLQDFHSIDRMSHLLKRLAFDAESGYQDFSENDRALENQALMNMSKLTHKLLQSIDYETAKNKRLENFNLLHNELEKSNSLFIDKPDNQVPLVYPFRAKDPTLRARLAENRIYTPKYWPNVQTWTNKDSIEYKLTEEIINFPIDQRYGLEDMEKILSYV